MLAIPLFIFRRLMCWIPGKLQTLLKNTSDPFFAVEFLSGASLPSARGGFSR
jgi:hypothetical protein